MNSRFWCRECRQFLRSFTTSIPHFTVYFIYFAFFFEHSTQHIYTHTYETNEREKGCGNFNAYYVFIIEATGCVYKIHTHFSARTSLLELK